MWQRVLVGVLFAPLTMLTAACVSNPADSCMRHSDCQQDGKAGVCAANGFCERECIQDQDCPCGSFCASGCGLCITNDLAGPATCTPDRWGLRPEAIVTGACRNARRTSEPEVDGGRVCASEAAEVAVCEDAAPPMSDVDAGDAGADGARP
jgi:hypothetical protein